MSKRATILRLSGAAANEIVARLETQGVVEIKAPPAEKVEEALRGASAVILLAPASSDGVEGQDARKAVAEAHHRIKNTLQNIISFIRIHFRKPENLSLRETERLARHIHTLADMHDLVADEMANTTSQRFVRVDSLLERTIEARGDFKIDFDLSPLRFAVRGALALAMLMNEILFEAEERKINEIKVFLGREGQANIFRVHFPSAPRNTALQGAEWPAENSIVALVCKSDLKAIPRRRDDARGGEITEIIFTGESEAPVEA
jgi:two-component sensor histidine kinase